MGFQVRVWRCGVESDGVGTYDIEAVDVGFVNPAFHLVCYDFRCADACCS